MAQPVIDTPAVADARFTRVEAENHAVGADLRALGAQ